MAPNVDETNARMIELMPFWRWLQMSTEPIPGCSIWWLSGQSTESIPICSIYWLSGTGSKCRRNRSQDAWFHDFLAMAPDVDGNNPRMLDLMFLAMAPNVDGTDPRILDFMTFWPWLRMSTQPIPGCSMWWLSGHGSRCRQDRSQDARFNDFLAMAPDVDGTDPRMPDLMTFWPWLQMSTEPIPGCSIWWLSGYGSRCRRKRSQDPWFNEFLAIAPNVNGTDPRMLDLMVFWQWLQMFRNPLQTFRKIEISTSKC